MTARKLTPKQRVRRKYPDAYADKTFSSGWIVFSSGSRYVNDGKAISGGFKRATRAWADAARRLE